MADTLDFPFDEVAQSAWEQVQAGNTIFQKFTCAGCGVRQTMAEPNQFYKTGKCEECGHVTDIVAKGCNFLLIASSSAGSRALLKKVLSDRDGPRK